MPLCCLRGARPMEGWWISAVRGGIRDGAFRGRSRSRAMPRGHTAWRFIRFAVIRVGSRRVAPGLAAVAKRLMAGSSLSFVSRLTLFAPVRHWLCLVFPVRAEPDIARVGLPPFALGLLPSAMARCRSCGRGSRSEFAVVSAEVAYAAATLWRIPRRPLRRSCRVRCRVFAAGPSSSAPARPRYASDSSMFAPGLLCRARLSWRLACCRARFIVAPDRRSSTLGFVNDLPGIRRLCPVFCGYGASMMFRQRLLAFFSR